MKAYREIEKGSEWRLWDLHFHTPSSFDYQDKSVTNQNIIDILSKASISVVVITDHHFIDTARIKELQLLGKKKNITVFPGIEFLSDSRGSDPVHFIGIFSPLCDISFVWGQIENKTKISEIKGMGKKVNEVYCDLEETTKLIHELDGIVSIHAGSKSNSIECITNSLSHSMAQKTDIAHNVDLYEIGKEKDQQGYIDIVFPSIKKRLPMIICSDNHNINKYKLKQNCWIKANPTFNGLKQVLSEPEGRIKIQELEPEYKSEHYIIDRVEYISSDGKKQIIYFNKSLNSIIGSRATGKSNLLKNIAYSIDPKQCVDRGETREDFLEYSDFKVYWSDGTVDGFDSDEDKKSKGLLFIPQNYLGKLIYKDNSDFDKFITDLFKNREDFQKAVTEYREFEDGNHLKITEIIQEILNIKFEGNEKREQIRKFAKKADYEKEIKSFELKIGKIGKTNKVSEDELKEHTDLSNDITSKNKELGSIKNDIESFKRLKTETVISEELVIDYGFSPRSFKRLKEFFLKSDNDFKKQFVEDEIKVLKKTEAEINKSIATLEKKIKPLVEKISKHKSLLDLTKQLKEKVDQKDNVENLTKEILDLKKQYKDKQKELVKIYLKLELELEKVKVDLKDLEYSKVTIVGMFDKKTFIDFIESNINYHNSTDLKGSKREEYKTCNKFLSSPKEWNYTDGDFKNLLAELLDGILSEAIHLKTGKSIETVLSELFINRFKIDYVSSVRSKNGNPFDDMSDGEQMLALLEFIFKFDEYDYPVLLDQPEDDLDSRAIADSIVKFIESQKVRRQIIIASHNANLVVCSDSEEIVVSNKTKKGKNTYVFSYETGAIEDEKIRGEIISILEGGEKALKKRMEKLSIEIR